MSLSVSEPCDVCSAPKSEAGKTSASRFRSSLPGPPSLTGSRSVDFWQDVGGAPYHGQARDLCRIWVARPNLFTQQVCRVGLDLAIQRGSAEEPAHRRRHLSSGEPGRARVSRCGPAGDSCGNGRLGESELAAKWERVWPRRRTSWRARTSFRLLYQGGGPQLPLLINTGRKRLASPSP